MRSNRDNESCTFYREHILLWLHKSDYGLANYPCQSLFIFFLSVVSENYFVRTCESEILRQCIMCVERAPWKVIPLSIFHTWIYDENGSGFRAVLRENLNFEAEVSAEVSCWGIFLIRTRFECTTWLTRPVSSAIAVILQSKKLTLLGGSKLVMMIG